GIVGRTGAPRAQCHEYRPFGLSAMADRAETRIESVETFLSASSLGGGKETMNFRPMILEDLDQIVEIEKASMPSPWSKELFEEELKREAARYFVGEEDGQVAGYMGYWEAPQEAHIINLAIAPRFRQKGFGIQLM